MSMFEAVKQISKQKNSSVTVTNMNKLLIDAEIPRALMGYDSWGNFSYSQVLYVIDNVGYIARRTKDRQDAPVAIKRTKDCIKTECGKLLTRNEIKEFKKLGFGQ